MCVTWVYCTREFQDLSDGKEMLLYSKPTSQKEEQSKITLHPLFEV